MQPTPKMHLKLIPKIGLVHPREQGVLGKLRDCPALERPSRSSVLNPHTGTVPALHEVPPAEQSTRCALNGSFHRSVMPTADGIRGCSLRTGPAFVCVTADSSHVLREAFLGSADKVRPSCLKLS